MSTNLTIHRLMSEKLAGIISASDEAYLDHLIETEEAVANAWENLKAQYASKDIENHFSRLEAIEWAALTEESGAPRKKPSIWMKMVTWSAAAVVLLGIGYYLYSSRQAKNNFADLSSKESGIKLRLTNGKTINLTNTTSTVSTGQATLNNSNKSLSFTINKGSDSDQSNGLNTLTVPISLDYKITLSDGSQIWMNSATVLKFPFAFNGDNREISINGEAYIEAAPDAHKPFLVHLPHGSVQVLGTSFNVNTYDSAIAKVSLVEGAIRVKTRASDVLLKPGNQAIVTTTGIKIGSFDEEELSWRYGLYYFTDASLDEICTVLPRWFGMKAVIDNNQATNQRFTGRIERNTPIKKFLDDLKATTSIDYSITDDVVHFK